MSFGNLLDRDSIARFLAAQDSTGTRNSISLSRRDARVGWDSLCEVPSEENPSVDVGQQWAARCKVGGGRALHVLGRGDEIVMHIDKHDPAEKPIRHVASETNLLAGAAVGAGLGILAALLGAPPKTAIGIGVALGAGVGVHVPVNMKVWCFDGVDEHGHFTFSIREGVTPQMLLAGRSTT